MTDFSYPSRPASDWASILAAMRRALALAMAALHYGLVWLVWLALFIVRPRLALEVFAIGAWIRPLAVAAGPWP